MNHEFEELSSRVLAAAIDVHKALGPGFLESLYERAFAVALRNRKIPFFEQAEVQIRFEGQNVGVHRLDFCVENLIVVELKAVRALEEIHFAQVRSYLKATGLRIGLLLNFNSSTLIIKRIVFG